MNGIRQAIEENAAARVENTAAAARLGDTLRAADFNGHVPDELTTGSKSDEWKAGYQQAILDVCYQLAKQAHDELTAVIERAGRAAA